MFHLHYFTFVSINSKEISQESCIFISRLPHISFKFSFIAQNSLEVQQAHPSTLHKPQSILSGAVSRTPARLPEGNASTFPPPLSV